MKSIITSILLMLSLTIYAQQVPLRAEKPGQESNVKQTTFSPLSLQILVGSQGLGADLKYGYLPKMSFRAGFSIMPVNVNNLFTFSGLATADQLSAKFSNVHLLADYSPFKGNHFRLVGGAAYIIRGNAEVTITPTGSYKFGDMNITKDQIGDLQAGVTWKGVAPYLGVALFKGFPNKLFNLNLDIGTYYLSSPNTSLTGTKLLADNSAQQPQFNQNMQGYHWLPVIQLNFNFKIK